MNSNIFSYLTPTGNLAFRLPLEERQAFLKKYKAQLCQAYGKVQIEYAEVPETLLTSTEELKPFFASGTVRGREDLRA